MKREIIYTDDNGIKYELQDLELECIGYENSQKIGKLKILAEIDGIPITSIGDSAFYNCWRLTGPLTIPSSVTSISNRAFVYCFGFTGNLIIPSNVNSIGEAAFYGCSGLDGQLIIPASVTSIGAFSFTDCCRFTGQLIIPASVTSIGDGAFKECSRLTEIRVPKTCADHRGAFFGCKAKIIRY